MSKEEVVLLVNFGGPRNLEDIPSFLHALLTDPDVIRSKMPPLLHHWIFSRVAKKRAVKIVKDYEEIGGKSPIFEDTVAIGELLEKKTGKKVITFHRYLTDTHQSFIELIKTTQADEIMVFPMFPQFSYATTGSIARWFLRHLPPSIVNKLRWVKSYPAHPSFVNVSQDGIKEFLIQNELKEEDVFLLFSAHGVPESFIEQGDIYETECTLSFQKIAQGFPKCLSKLCYQSKFGRGEWLKPYTDEVCKEVLSWHERRKQIVFIPLSFTSDHIETLFEIEKLYLPIIREKGLKAYRCPAMNRRLAWIDAISQILEEGNICGNQMLIRAN